MNFVHAGRVNIIRARVLALCAAISMLAVTPAAASAYRAAVEARFPAWVEELRAEAAKRGISSETFDEAMKGVRLNWSLPDLDPPDLGPGAPERPRAEVAGRQKQQAEFDRPSRYFPRKYIAALARTGRDKRAGLKSTLEKIEQDFGVESHVLLALWGRETAYGRAHLPHDAIRALATQAYIGRRRKQFREELLLALEILEERHIARGAMRSSWAGAMGHTQFMPSDFRRYAVDFDGDGRRDIWRTVPDALASTANFLRQNGWESGKTWGYEVRLPKDFDCTLEGLKNERPIADWLELGVTRTFDRSFPPERMAEPAHLVLPAGVYGPAFLALRNFQVLKRYNMADTYALFVGHVADRIIHDRDFEGGWSGVPSFSRDHVRRMQESMAANGIYEGKIDGLIGGMTRAAVGRYQRKLDIPVTCYPSRALMKRFAARG